MLRLALFCLLYLVVILNCNSDEFTGLKLANIHTFSDDMNGIDGLDNPRMAKISHDGAQLFVVSGDDNSLAIFDVQKDYSLVLNQIFKAEHSTANKLTGASDIVLLNKSSTALVASFYDGALSVFDKQTGGQFAQSNVFSDNLTAQRVFKSNEPVGVLDKLGLLGAWGIAKSDDEQDIFVASYKSDAIVHFNVGAEGKLKLIQRINSTSLQKAALGSPVDVIHVQQTGELFVAGFGNNTISILSQQLNGSYALKQQLSNGKNNVSNLVNPQKLMLSKSGLYLYVACAGSNTIAVFKRTDSGFNYLQSVTSNDVSSGLKSVGSLAISTDGKYLFAGGENDAGLLVFDILSDGKITLNHKFLGERGGLKGISSITQSNDGKYLVVTSSKRDEIHMIMLH